MPLVLSVNPIISVPVIPSNRTLPIGMITEKISKVNYTSLGYIFYNMKKKIIEIFRLFILYGGPKRRRGHLKFTPKTYLNFIVIFLYPSRRISIEVLEIMYPFFIKHYNEQFEFDPPFLNMVYF